MSSIKDRYSLVLWIFLIHGIGSLLPWNMFITADKYFTNYKLNPENITDSIKNYRDNFLAYTGIVSKLPNVLFQALNLLYHTNKYNLYDNRVQLSLLFQIFIFFLTIVLAFLDTHKWTEIFFFITMICIAIINVFNAIYQNCIYGLAGNMPSKYTTMVVTGMNISGIFSALVLIASVTASTDQKLQGIYYFLMALVFLVICSILHEVVRRNKFYKYNQDLSQLTNQQAKECEPSLLEQLAIVWKTTRSLCLNVFFIYFIALSIFPSVICSIEQIDNLISEVYFHPVYCFLSFNFFSTLGSLSCNYLPKIPAKHLWLATLLRFAFIPYFLCCNYLPNERKWPIYFNSDYYLIFGVIALGFTSGYLSCLNLCYIPKSVDIRLSKKAGMISSFFVIIGILSGVIFTPVYKWLVMD